MRVPTKSIVLMGGNHTVGGVCFDHDINLYIAYNDVNKLVKMHFADPYPGPNSVQFSMNALGYLPYCEVRSMTYYYSTRIDKGIIMLLKNGEIWHKSLSTFQEVRWPANPDGTSLAYPETAPYPPGLGASGIEYYNDAVYLTYPQFNKVRKLAVLTLSPIATYPMGVPTDTPYPPAAVSWDGVNTRWVTIDPVKGDIVYGNQFDFAEGGREKYTYGIFNECFEGDIAWSKTAIPTAPTKDYFVIGFKNKVTAFMEPWYKLYTVNDFTGIIEEVDGVLFDNVEVGEMVVKHLRIENMTNTLRQAMTMGIVPDATISADDDMGISLSPTGPWHNQISMGDFPGLATLDFYMRYFPAVNTERGIYTVQLAINFTA